MPSAPAFRVSNPGEVAVPTAVYSHVATIRPGTRTIHTAGQIGTDLDGKAPASYPEQIKLALANLEACLRAAGATAKDVVKLTYYIVGYDPKKRSHVEILSAWLSGHKPATTLVPVPALARPDVLFEIEATAAVRDPSTLPPFARPARGDSTLVDVVVVGGGLSGLSAAHDVQRAGHSCVVLEARDRVGGKTWSIPVAGGKGNQDEGAAWINSVNQSRMWGLAQRFGLETVVQNTVGHALAQEAGKFRYGELPPFSTEDQESIAKVRDGVEALCHKVDIRRPWATKDERVVGKTLAELAVSLGATPTALATVTVWTRVMLGKEAHEVGALFFLDYCKSGGGLLRMRSDEYAGGQHLRIRQGTQSFSKGLASTLQPGSVLLSSPVARIAQSEAESPACCTVTTRDGTRFLCRRVIVSVPTPLYQDIFFAPALPAAKAELARRTSLGFLGKVILVFPSPWWRARGFCGLTQSFAGPINIARDTSVDRDGVWALTCFAVGDAGRAWAAKYRTKEERVRAYVRHLRDIYGEDVVPDPSEALVQVWNDEEFSKGGPSPVMPAGVMEKLGHALREPAGFVHFVGTETSYEWKGYMEGAVRSGERGAEEVVRALAAEDGEKSFFVAKL